MPLLDIRRKGVIIALSAKRILCPYIGAADAHTTPLAFSFTATV